MLFKMSHLFFKFILKSRNNKRRNPMWDKDVISARWGFTATSFPTIELLKKRMTDSITVMTKNPIATFL